MSPAYVEACVKKPAIMYVTHDLTTTSVEAIRERPKIVLDEVVVRELRVFRFPSLKPAIDSGIAVTAIRLKQVVVAGTLTSSTLMYVVTFKPVLLHASLHSDMTVVKYVRGEVVLKPEVLTSKVVITPSRREEVVTLSSVEVRRIEARRINLSESLNTSLAFKPSRRVREESLSSVEVRKEVG